jgi:DnaJ-class molecular chaperone
MKLYDDLGVSPNASQDEIKKAYRKLAQQHHPDKQGDPAAFRRVQQAYDVLGDPGRRQQYDETGQTKEPVGIREDAVRHVCTVVLKMVDEASTNVDTQNLVSMIHSHITDVTRQIQARRDAAAKLKAKRQKALDRLTFKGDDGPDLIRQTLEDAIKGVDRDLAVLDRHDQITREMRAIVKQYSYVNDKGEEYMDLAQAFRFVDLKF